MKRWLSIPMAGLTAAGLCLLLMAACGRNGGSSSRNERPLSIAASDGKTPLLLVPGRAAGSLVIGAPDTALDRLGEPGYGDAAMGKALRAWSIDADTGGYGLSVLTARDMGNDETSRIRQIRVASPRFKTAESLMVGVALLKISAVHRHALHIVDMPTADDDAYTVYDTDQGIAYEVDAAYRCRAIIIYDPAFGLVPFPPLPPPSR